MKVSFFNRDVVDCTSDPHCVSFDGLIAALDTIQKVLEHDVVEKVTSVEFHLKEEGKKEKEKVHPQDGDVVYESDWLSRSDWNKKKKQQLTHEAKVAKTYGLYFGGDPEPTSNHLRIGLTGARDAIKMVNENPERFMSLSIGVIWSFAGDCSCSDYITMPPEEPTEGLVEVDFSNQDSWISMEGYEEHCRKLSDVIGVPGCIEPNESKY